MDQLRKILVAIRDPRGRTQRALTKAAQLAATSGARLELFHAISDPLYDDPLLFSPDALIGHEARIRERHLEHLEHLAAPLRELGLTVSCAAVWDFPAAHAVVRRSMETRADLIVADGRASHSGRWLLRYTDWELLRLSSKPVLLVKSARAYGAAPTVLAAVDPNHAADKPARLDKEILRISKLLQSAVGGQLHVLHAYVPGTVGLRPEQMAREGFAERLERRALNHASRALERELKASGIANASAHLVGLHPVNAIPATARKVHADVVIMGAISRSGLRRVLLGNTAEKVLDELKCDVLVVKPPRFTRRVASETRGPNLRAMMMPNYA